MALKFGDKFNGLQIKWDDGMEIESISLKMLLSVGSESTLVTTSGYCKWDGEYYNYEYDSNAVRVKNTIKITYDNPPPIVKTMDWGYEFGILEIEFDKSDLSALSGVSWRGNILKKKYWPPYSFKLARKDDAIQGKPRPKLSSEYYKRNQSEFKSELFSSSKIECCFTGEALKDVLQAAHIVPVSKRGTDNASNGVLLRADIHILFDKGLIWVDPETGLINVNERIAPYLPAGSIKNEIGSEILVKTKAAFEWRKNNFREME